MEKKIKYDIIVRYLKILVEEQKYINISDIEFILKVLEDDKLNQGEENDK